MFWLVLGVNVACVADVLKMRIFETLHTTRNMQFWCSIFGVLRLRVLRSYARKIDSFWHPSRLEMPVLGHHFCDGG